MFVVKNALKSITRSKGRNILVGIIVVTIAFSATIALSIKNAASNAETAGLQGVKVTAVIGVDREAMLKKAQESASSSSGEFDRGGMREAFAEVPDLTLSQYNAYAAASTVSVATHYQDAISVSKTSSKFLAVTASEETTNSSADASKGGPGVFMEMSGNTGDFNLTGFSSDDAVEAAANGTFTMASGAVFDYTDSSLNEVIIPSALATFNNTAVGDTITLANPGKSNETYTFKVVGIYTNTTTSAATNHGPRSNSTANDPANQIYTNYATVAAIEAESLKNPTTATNSSGFGGLSSYTPALTYTFVLDSQDAFDQFKLDVTAAGLPDTYTVTSPDVANYQASLVPLKNLSSFATTLLWIILLVGAIILVVLNLFNIRERKYEVGVLTAIGIKKGKVAAQFAVELLIVVLVGIAVGAGAGAASSVPVSNSLLSSQVSAAQTSASTAKSQFGRERGITTGAESGDVKVEIIGDAPGPNFGSSATTVNYLDEINATVDFSVLLEIIGIGILLSLLSSIGGIIFVSRYEPLQILADRA
jgi:putative ABC transport system permease protein